MSASNANALQQNLIDALALAQKGLLGQHRTSFVSSTGPGSDGLGDAAGADRIQALSTADWAEMIGLLGSALREASLRSSAGQAGLVKEEEKGVQMEEELAEVERAGGSVGKQVKENARRAKDKGKGPERDGEGDIMMSTGHEDESSAVDGPSASKSSPSTIAGAIPPSSKPATSSLSDQPCGSGRPTLAPSSAVSSHPDALPPLLDLPVPKTETVPPSANPSLKRKHSKASAGRMSINRIGKTLTAPLSKSVQAAVERDSRVAPACQLMLEAVAVLIAEPSDTEAPVNPTSSKATAQAPAGGQRAKNSPESQPILRLPKELVARILREAVVLTEQTLPNVGNHFKGGSTYGQEWIHSVALVCSDLAPIARSVAWSNLFVWKRQQLVSLLRTLASQDGLACNVAELQIEVPQNEEAAQSRSRAMRSAVNRNRFGGPRLTAFSNSQLGVYPDPQANQPGEKRDLAKLLERVKDTLQSLQFAMTPFDTFSTGFGSADLLEPGVLDAMVQLQSLRSLAVGHCIEFEELEVIMNALPNLTELRLEDGVRSFDAGALPSLSHECKFTSFCINDTRGGAFTTDQLVWLLSSSSGHLRNLLISTSQSRGNWLMFGNAGANQPPPFATEAFANLLTQLAPTLLWMEIREIQVTVGQQQQPALGAFFNAPHLGTFDHAMSHAYQLRHASLEWVYTGDGFFASLPPSLASIRLDGSPNANSGRELTSRLEEGGFPQLKSIRLSNFPDQSMPAGLGNGWNPGEAKALRKACAARSIHFMSTGVMR